MDGPPDQAQMPGTQAPHLGLFPPALVRMLEASSAPASGTFQHSAWFVCFPSRHQSVFTDVTSLSANQSQSRNPQPQKSAAGLPCVAITAEDLLRVLLPLESAWNIPPSSTQMASPAPLPISSKSPLMLRAQLGFSRPSWCHGAERSPLASGHFFFFSLCFPLGITVKSSLGPCTAYPEA